MGLPLTAAPRLVTLAELRSAADSLRSIGRRYGIVNIRVFGSVARGEATKDSDLDLLVDVAPGTGILTLGEFALAVEDLLDVPTQVATLAGLPVTHRDTVLREAVPV